MMKKIALMALVVGFSGQALAVDLCLGTAAKAQVAAADVDATGAGTKFLRSQFFQACSNNILLKFSQDTTKAWVASGSKKGKTSFLGNTEGVAPRASSTACTATGCTSGDVDASLTLAQTAS